MITTQQLYHGREQLLFLWKMADGLPQF